MNTEQLSDLLQLVYRAGIEPEVWPEVMLGISDALGSTNSSLLVRPVASGGQPFGTLDPRAPLDAFAEYVEEYVQIDELAEAARARPSGLIVTERTAIAPEILSRSHCYNDFYLRHSVGRFIGTNIINDDESAASLVVFRSQHAESFSESDERVMQLIAPHVAGALRIHNRLAETRQRVTLTTEALALLPTGVALLDEKARVLWINPAGEEIIGAADGLSVSRGELVTGRSSDSIDLRQALAAATSLDLLDGRSSHLLVERPSAKPAYILFISPAGRGTIGDTFQPAAIVFITDPARKNGGLQRHLRDIYGLTPAEAELTASLCDGKTSREIAEERGVSPETVRTQLRQVLSKTNTHRQVDLVRTILSGPGAAPRN